MITELQARDMGRSGRVSFSWIFLFCACLLWKCTSPENSQPHSLDEVADEIEEVSKSATEVELDASLLADTREVSQTLSQLSPDSFSFKELFPFLYELLENNPEDLGHVKAFAEQAVSRSSFSQEKDLLNLIEERDTEVIPLLLPYFESMDPEVWDKNYDGLSKELSMMGIQMTSAEGMFTGLGPRSLFTENLKLREKTPLIQYDAFTDAQTRSMNGEYPYSNLEPYIKMVLLGEKMEEEGTAKSYYEKIGQSFAEALHVLTDVHLITNEGARVGGVHTEVYPYMISLESLREALPRFEQSKFKEPLQRIVEFPSEMSLRPEHLHLLVESWAESEEEAKKQVEEHLRSGKDIPHYLAVEKGDGSTQYAVVYRFFEDADQAEKGLQIMQTQFNTGEMIFVSSEKNKLYQLGY